MKMYLLFSLHGYPYMSIQLSFSLQYYSSNYFPYMDIQVLFSLHVSLQDFFKSFPAILPDEVEEIAGRGLKGKFGLEKIWLGSEQFLKESGEINLPSTATNLPSIYTMVYLKICIKKRIKKKKIKH